MLVASVKEIRKGVQVQGKTIMNYCRHVAEGLAACTRYGSACTCFWFTPNTSSALWTWVVLSATYVSLRVSLFFPVRDRRICTSTSDQPIAFVVPLIVPYQEEKPLLSHWEWTLHYPPFIPAPLQTLLPPQKQDSAMVLNYTRSEMIMDRPILWLPYTR